MNTLTFLLSTVIELYTMVLLLRIWMQWAHCDFYNPFSQFVVKVTQPIIGHIPYGLVIAAIVWSLMGTGLLAVVGIKLPGLEFKNQRVEAAYRKELVYGEDDATRATPPTVRELFSAVRKNYFRLYFHYMYFNIARILYLQVDKVFGLFLLFPSIVAGTITLGLMTQITNVFGQVRGAFQYLINSWTTLVELMSIYKRLRSFEHELDGDKIQEVTHTLS